MHDIGNVCVNLSFWVSFQIDNFFAKFEGSSFGYRNSSSIFNFCVSVVPELGCISAKTALPLFVLDTHVLAITFTCSIKCKRLHKVHSIKPYTFNLFSITLQQLFIIKEQFVLCILSPDSRCVWPHHSAGSLAHCIVFVHLYWIIGDIDWFPCISKLNTGC